MSTWTDVNGIAAHLGLSPHTIYKLTQRGQLPFGRAGKRLVFNVPEVEQYVRKRGSTGQVQELEPSAVEQAEDIAGRIMGEV